MKIRELNSLYTTIADADSMLNHMEVPLVIKNVDPEKSWVTFDYEVRGIEGYITFVNKWRSIIAALSYASKTIRQLINTNNKPETLAQQSWFQSMKARLAVLTTRLLFLRLVGKHWWDVATAEERYHFSKKRA